MAIGRAEVNKGAKVAQADVVFKQAWNLPLVEFRLGIYRQARAGRSSLAVIASFIQTIYLETKVKRKVELCANAKFIARSR